MDAQPSTMAILIQSRRKSAIWASYRFLKYDRTFIPQEELDKCMKIISAQPLAVHSLSIERSLDESIDIAFLILEHGSGKLCIGKWDRCNESKFMDEVEEALLEKATE